MTYTGTALGQAVAIPHSDQGVFMKNLKLIFLSILVVTMSAACAKKDSEFAARYAKNRMGAEVADGKRTQEAGEHAEALGVTADLVDIALQSQNWETAAVRSVILLNDKQMAVTTQHTYNSGNVSEGTVEKDGYQIGFRGYCAASAAMICARYYASLEIYKDGALVIQEGVLKSFEGGRDMYQWNKPDAVMTFQQLINLLDDAAAQADTSIK